MLKPIIIMKSLKLVNQLKRKKSPPPKSKRRRQTRIHRLSRVVLRRRELRVMPPLSTIPWNHKNSLFPKIWRRAIRNLSRIKKYSRREERKLSIIGLSRRYLDFGVVVANRVVIGGQPWCPACPIAMSPMTRSMRLCGTMFGPRKLLDILWRLIIRKSK